MSRGDGVKDIIRLALLMESSFRGLSIQDIHKKNTFLIQLCKMNIILNT